MSHWRVRLLSVPALSVVIGGVLVMPVPQAAQATARQGWDARLAGSAVTTMGGELSGVSAISGSNAWAVGAQPTASGVTRTLILHWNGTAWSRITSPNPGAGGNELRGVRATSGSNAWAVGASHTTHGVTRTLILHWNGTAWSRVASPNPSPIDNRLSGVSATSGASAWAVGTYSTTSGASRTLILHWNGTAWSRVASPNPSLSLSELSGVSATSGTSAWAVGHRCNSACTGLRTLILHWNGRSWSKVTSPNPSTIDDVLRGVSATSGGNAWAAGTYCTSAACRTLIVHWNGTAWSKVASPNPGPDNNQLYGVNATSGGNAWAVGSYCTTSACSAFRTLILHWNGTTWSKVTSPNPSPGLNELSGVSATSGANAWAVGSYSTTSGASRTLIVHWNGTAWSRR